MRVVHIAIANVGWVALYVQVGTAVIGSWGNVDSCHRYRLVWAGIINNGQLVFAGFGNFYVVYLTVFIQIEVIDLVVGVVDGFF